MREKWKSRANLRKNAPVRRSKRGSAGVRGRVGITGPLGLEQRRCSDERAVPVKPAGATLAIEYCSGVQL
jgi:hypothetical protein